MPGIHHLDLVVSDLERSLAFYRGLLQPLGYVREGPIVGERGERVVYFDHIRGEGAIGLRERQSDAHGVPYDRYAVGVHHVAFAATSRAMVHERTAWLAEQGVTIESGPREYDYIPGYFAVFFYDPDHQARDRARPGGSRARGDDQRSARAAGTVGGSLRCADSRAPGVTTDTRRAAAREGRKG